MEDVHRRFLDRFDMIFTRICETQPHVVDFSQTGFGLAIYKCLFLIDEIGTMFLETIFLCN